MGALFQEVPYARFENYTPRGQVGRRWVGVGIDNNPKVLATSYEYTPEGYLRKMETLTREELLHSVMSYGAEPHPLQKWSYGYDSLGQLRDIEDQRVPQDKVLPGVVG